MNAASPVSAGKTRLFVRIASSFDKDGSLGRRLAFNAQVFAEDQAVVERQFPICLPLDIHAEAHFAADRTSATYRRLRGQMGLGR